MKRRRMTTPRPLSESDLHGYADGSCRPSAPPRSRRRSRAIPEAAARVAAIRAQNAAACAGARPVARRADSRAAAGGGDASRARARVAAWWRPALAIAATLVVGVAIGWFGREALLAQQGTPTTFAREAAFSHAIYAGDQGRPVEVGAQEEARLVRWLTRRLGVEVPPPDLTGVGFSLVGGRLVAGNEKPTALLMYENADKQRLTLQWRKNDPKRERSRVPLRASRTASASSTGSTRTARTRCPATSTARGCSPSRTSCHGQLAAGYAQHLQR